MAVYKDGFGYNNKPNTPRPKKKKHTYQILKEEAQRLREEIELLRHELAAQEKTADDESFRFQRTTRTNQMLKNAVYTQQLAIASAQSMISNHLNDQRDTSIYTYIHLPTNWSDRREILLATKKDKFMQCYSYLTERCRSLNMQKSHSFEERSEDRDGNSTCHRFDVIQFHGVQSLKQVYEALTFVMFNMEISISEALGAITNREEYDRLNDGAYASNHRLVSNHESGMTTEANTVSFAQLFENPNEFGGWPCAVVTTDSVDQDDLHPYDLNRVRRDITAGIVLTPEWRTRHAECNGTCNDEESTDKELVVVMRRVAFIKVHIPEFDISDHELTELFDHVTKWPDVMVRSVREILSAQIL